LPEILLLLSSINLISALLFENVSNFWNLPGVVQRNLLLNLSQNCIQSFLLFECFFFTKNNCTILKLISGLQTESIGFQIDGCLFFRVWVEILLSQLCAFLLASESDVRESYRKG
jgi:hypothetical protein